MTKLAYCPIILISSFLVAPSSLSAKVKKENKLLWMVCGSRDGLIGNSTQLKAFCDENGIPCTLISYPDGEHNFVVWKYGLYKFAQLIFK